MTCLRDSFDLKVTQVCHKIAKTRIKQIHGSLILTPPVTYHVMAGLDCVLVWSTPAVQSFRSDGKVRLIGLIWPGVMVWGNFPVAGLCCPYYY